MDSFFTVDVEKDIRTGEYLGIVKGVPELLKMLKGHKVKAVFFFTGEIIERFPEIVKKVARGGHEVAIHGYSHKRFDSLSAKEKEKEIEMSVRTYKKILKKNPLGFRAPQHSIDKETIILLKKHGFNYDSSICVGNIMLLRHLIRRGSNKKQIIESFFGKKRRYEIIPGFIEIPRVSPVLSLGGFELKIYPDWLISLIITLHKFFRIPINFVMHSWDMIDTRGSRTSRICSAKEFKLKLDRFIGRISKEYKVRRMEEVV